MAGVLIVTTIFVLSYVFDAAEGGLSALGKNDVDVKVTTIYTCDEETIFNGKMDVTPQGLSFDGVFQTTIDNSYRSVLQVDQHVDGDQWKENFYTYKDNICNVLDKFASRAWERIRTSVKPPIPDKCKIEPGTYSLKNLQVPFTDIDNVPPIFFGQFRITLKAFNEDDELFFCSKIEVEMKKK